MSAAQAIAVIGVGMTSAVGLSAPVTAASVRAGITGFRESTFRDRHLHPMVLAALHNEDLPALSGALSSKGLERRERRMLQLGGAALRESLVGAPSIGEIALYLALPAPMGDLPSPGGPAFLEALALQADLPLHAGRSRLFPSGRAGGFQALKEAIVQLRKGAERYVVVGGVDSPLDERLLRRLDFERRLRARGVSDGLTPGEGAAFLLLATAGDAAQLGRTVLGLVDGAATAEEPGHLYSEEPYRGEGLHAAFRGLFADVGEGAAAPIGTVYAGFTGESFHAKEWGVAFIRHRRRFAEPLAIQHPADCLGDTGAALGPMMAALALVGMARGYRRSPCLTWCSSDRELRGCALLRRGSS